MAIERCAGQWQGRPCGGKASAAVHDERYCQEMGIEDYHPFMPASAPSVPVSRGAALIAAERQRQIEVEGWTPEHDGAHRHGELVEAAIAYAMAAIELPNAARKDWWPWASEYWKPSDDPVRNLVRAGALIAAELDRLEAALGADTNEASDGE